MAKRRTSSAGRSSAESRYTSPLTGPGQSKAYWNRTARRLPSFPAARSVVRTGWATRRPSTRRATLTTLSTGEEFSRTAVNARASCTTRRPEISTSPMPTLLTGPQAVSTKSRCTPFRRDKSSIRSRSSKLTRCISLKT